MSSCFIPLSPSSRSEDFEWPTPDVLFTPQADSADSCPANLSVSDDKVFWNTSGASWISDEAEDLQYHILVLLDTGRSENPVALYHGRCALQ